MDKATADKILKTLEAVQARPVLYFGNSADLRAYQSFMARFQSALSALGIEYPSRSMFPEVFSNRGWKSSWIDIHEMQERGLNDEQIIQEMMLIEILIWKSRGKHLDE